MTPGEVDTLERWLVRLILMAAIGYELLVIGNAL